MQTVDITSIPTKKKLQKNINKMANDLVTRLNLDNKNFDSNITKSTRQIQQFKRQSEAQSIAIRKAFDGIAKKAGGIGIALIGLKSTKDIFDGIINSSQTLSDSFNNNMGAMKSSVDTFFSAMTTGDFSGFLNGLGDVYDKAIAVQQALDQLGNTKMSFDYFDTKTQARISEAREIATNKNASNEARTAAFTDWDTAIKEKEDYTQTLQSDLVDVLRKSIVTGCALGMDQIDISDFEKVLKIDLLPDDERTKAKDKFDADLSYYDSQLKKLTNNGMVTQYGFGGVIVGQKATEQTRSNEEVAKDIAKLNEEYKDAILYRQILVKWQDEELQKNIALGKEYFNLNQAITDSRRALNRAQNSFSETGFTPTQTSTPIATINYDFETTNQLMESLFDNALKGNGKVVSKWEIQVNPVAPERVEDTEDVLSLLDQQKDNYIKSINDRATAINSLSGAFSSLSGLMQSNGNDWGAWALGAVANTMSVISQISSLIAQQMALGIATQSALVFPYNVVAMTATAGALASTIASLPKFETGGVVGGSSYYGDKILARVNSGEVILNQAQQRSLLSQLESGESGGQVEFRIRGSQLVGVINNYNKTMSRRL